jgi:CubicO group peptidase (beta-lactamase class C family)
MPDFGTCLRTTALGLAVLAATQPPAFSLSDQSDGYDRVAQQMDHFVSSRDFSGTVLVARDGRVLFQKAYGLANREHEVPNKLNTKFRLGSHAVANLRSNFITEI